MRNLIDTLRFNFKHYRPTLSDIYYSVREDWGELLMENYYGGPDYHVSLPIRVLLITRMVIREISTPLRYSYCSLVHDHKPFHNEGYGTPEHGGDGGYCERCGWGFWVQFY